MLVGHLTTSAGRLRVARPLGFEADTQRRRSAGDAADAGRLDQPAAPGTADRSECSGAAVHAVDVRGDGFDVDRGAGLVARDDRDALEANPLERGQIAAEPGQAVPEGL